MNFRTDHNEGDHVAIRADLARFRALRLLGVFPPALGEDATGPVLELRECSCGSSIALELAPAPCPWVVHARRTTGGALLIGADEATVNQVAELLGAKIRAEDPS